MNNNDYKRTEDNNEESDEIQIKDIDDNNNEIDFNNDNVIINKSINKNKNKDMLKNNAENSLQTAKTAGFRTVWGETVRKLDRFDI